MDKAIVESVKKFVNGGMMANFMDGGMNINSLRTNALLRKEEWIEFDTTVVQVARARLNGIADLRAAGLVKTLGGLGTLISQYEAVSDMTDANVSMSAATPGEEDDVLFDLKGVPVPIIHKDFRINLRRLLASRRLGDGIDTTQAAVASRKVADMQEQILFKGIPGKTVDGLNIYGYTTHPNRNTGTSVGLWASIANIYPTILNMVQDANDDNFYGPFIVYVAKDLWPLTLQVYTDGSGQTARERIISKIPEVQDIRHADELANGEMLLVEMTGQTVDLAVAQDISTVEWETQGGMVAHFKVMSAMVPRIKADYNGNMGLVHYTGGTSGS